MTDLIQKSLRDSKTARWWTALAIVSLTMFCMILFYGCNVSAAGTDATKHKLGHGRQYRLWDSLPGGMAGSMYFS